jgi:hypothetical protein
MADGKRIPLHDGGFLTWDEKGKRVEGVFAGFRNGQYGELVVLQTVNGKVALATPSILKSALQGVTIGTQIEIIYKGEDAPKKKGQSGLKRFEVYAIES